MNKVLVIILGLFFGCAGIFIGYRFIKKPLKIEFIVSILNCIAQALMMFATITFVMFIENAVIWVTVV